MDKFIELQGSLAFLISLSETFGAKVLPSDAEVSCRPPRKIQTTDFFRIFHFDPGIRDPRRILSQSNHSDLIEACKLHQINIAQFELNDKNRQYLSMF